MSAQESTKKRKSADGNSSAVKRAKVTKSADMAPPLKSALKKPKEKALEGVDTNVSSKETKPKPRTTKVETAKPLPAKHVERSIVDDAEESENQELTADQTAALLAGFSSSEEEGDSEDEAGVAISSLPKAPTTGLIQKRIKQAIAEQDDPETTPGVIYIGRIPHGFYEPQMKAYFSQFGEILHLRLGRNKKTGKSQHHGFIEFASAAVADIVVKTMDKYLMFGRILQVRRVPREQVKDNLFHGAGRKKKPPPRNRIEGSRLKRGASRDVWEQRVEKENQRRVGKAEKLKELGYEFDMPVVKAVSAVPVKPKAIEAGIGAEPVSVDIVEQVEIVQPEVEADVVVTETTTQKRRASGRTETKKVVKKAKK